MDELLHKEFKEVGISLSSIALSKGMQPKNFFHFLFSAIPGCPAITWQLILVFSPRPRLGLSHVLPLDLRRLPPRSALNLIFLRTHIKPHPPGARRGTRGLLGISTDPHQLFTGSGRYGRRLSHAVFTSFLEQTWVIHQGTGAGIPPAPHSAQIMSQIPGACWGEFDILNGLTDSASCDHWILWALMRYG